VQESLARRAFRRFRRHRLAVAGCVLLAIVAILAVLAPYLVSFDPARIDLSAVRHAPDKVHLLGTDDVGRDVWSRLVFGARTSLIVGFGAVFVSLLIGVTLGVIGGYYGGWPDQIIGRVTDTVMSMPALLMVIVFVSVVGPSIVSVLTVIALLTWPGSARLVRGQYLALREAEFVVAARVIGARNVSIIVRHLFPNVLGPLTVAATFGVAQAILVEAGLSFLGLSVRPPASSWGVMINAAQQPDVLIGMPWLWIPPAVAIALTVLSVTFVGDGLRDAVDPRSSLGAVRVATTSRPIASTRQGAATPATGQSLPEPASGPDTRAARVA
jgi:peptide/nickel transport system permease protein